MYARFMLVAVPSLRVDEVVHFVGRLSDNQDFAPTHWGESANLRNDYTHQSLGDFLGGIDRSDPDRFWQPSLRRIRDVRYLLTWVASEGTSGWIEGTSQPPVTDQNLPRWFELASLVASNVRVDVGMAVTIPDQASAFGDLQGIHPEVVPAQGLRALFSRNYFSPRVFERFGDVAAFERLGCVVTTLSNGVVQLDLSRTPWGGDAEAMLATRRAAEAIVDAAGCLAVDGRPAPRWRSLLG